MRKSPNADDKISLPLRAMRNRRYAEILVDSIVVVSSRKRDQKRFADNIRSINMVGLYKPIIVNSRTHKTTKQYELICGEGRLLAYQHLGKNRIRAEIINVPESGGSVDDAWRKHREKRSRRRRGRAGIATNAKRRYDACRTQ